MAKKARSTPQEASQPKKTAPARKPAQKRSSKAEKAEEPKAKRGRPPKLVANEGTLQTIQGLGMTLCTTKEAAAVLGVSEPTFIDFLKRNEKAAVAFEQGKEKRKVSLRRLQLKAAEAGNVTMLIWLGKQLLGQKDRTEVEHDVSDGLADLMRELDGHGASLI